MKKKLSLALVLIMLVCLCACTQTSTATKSEEAESAAPAATAAVSTDAPIATPEPTQAPANSIEAQLNLIYSNFSSLNPGTDAKDTYYSVTDLDHNGRLELIGVATQGAEMTTTGKIFEVDDSFAGFKEVTQKLVSGYSLPDIITESADTYHDTATNTYYYVFKDVARNGNNESVTTQCSLNMKDGVISITNYGSETTVVINGTSAVEYKDANGNTVTPDEYVSVSNSFANYGKSSTNLGWFQASEVQNESRLATSYSVFNGTTTPSSDNETVPVQTAAPAQTPVPTQQVIITSAPKFLMITKNPTSEYGHYVGDSCEFIAKADNMESATWTFVDPYGNEYNTQTVANYYGVGVNTVSYAPSTTLYLYNLPLSLNGWGAYCTFYGNGQTARSNTAYLGISEKTIYNSTYGYLSMAGTDNFAVAIYLPNFGTTVYVSPSICSVSGQMYDGASCTVNYTGNTPTGNSGGSIYSVSIQGSVAPTPQPVYDQTVWGTIGPIESMNSVPIIINGNTFYTTRDYCVPQGADIFEGRQVLVHYISDYGNITQVDLF